MGLFEELHDEAELDNSIAPHEPLASIFENRVIRLGERHIEDNTRAGITNGSATMQEFDGAIWLFGDTSIVLSTASDDGGGLVR